MVVNFLQETLEIMDYYGYEPEDIIYIGDCQNYECTWKEFEKLANIKYDHVFDIYKDEFVKVAENLSIFFKDNSYMYRNVFHINSTIWKENWVFQKSNTIPKRNLKSITKLVNPNNDTGYDFEINDKTQKDDQ